MFEGVVELGRAPGAIQVALGSVVIAEVLNLIGSALFAKGKHQFAVECSRQNWKKVCIWCLDNAFYNSEILLYTFKVRQNNVVLLDRTRAC